MSVAQIAASEAGGASLADASLMSPSAGGAAPSNGSMPKRCAMRARAKASSSAVALSPSRPHPKCLSRGPLTFPSRPASIRPRHSEHVLADERQDQVGRDRRDLHQPGFAPFALDVVVLGEPEAAVGLERG